MIVKSFELNKVNLKKNNFFLFYGENEGYKNQDPDDTYYVNRDGEEITEDDEYDKFFQSALKKFDASSPADMDDEKKKKFFNYVDKNYDAKDERD